MKSAAQMLLERVFRTWIDPIVVARQKQDPSLGPIPLRIILLIWEVGGPQVFLNNEVFGRIRKMDVVAAGPIAVGQPVTSSDIHGIGRVVLTAELARYPYIVVVQGHDNAYFLASRKMSQVVSTEDFEVHALSLSRDGVILQRRQDLGVFVDLNRNIYQGATTPSQKRRAFAEVAKSFGTSNADVRNRVRRYLRLPMLVAHDENEFLPLLMETRATYIDGHFFSSIVSAVTTADRICTTMMRRAGLPHAETRQLMGLTFGQKIQPLRSRHLISEAQVGLLRRLNRIRNRHVHARKSPSDLTCKRDALTGVRILHEFLEGTGSVFRDYVIEDGQLVPRLLT